MATHVKIRGQRDGDNIKAQFYMGPDADHLELTGVLVMRVGEWQVFGAALLIGSIATQGHLIVQVEDPLRSEVEIHKPIEDLELNTRAHNVVAAMGCSTIGDLCRHSRSDLWDQPNCGERTIAEIVETLAGRGLRLRDE